MTENGPRSPVICRCGVTVQQRNFSQHCSSKRHVKSVDRQTSDAKDEDNKSDDEVTSDDFHIELPSFLREHDLRSDRKRLRQVADRYEQEDPYTKLQLNMEFDKPLVKCYDVDHVHEAQVLALAIVQTPELTPRVSNTRALIPLRSVINSISNLVITDAKVNRSKGQAVKYFLNHFQKPAEMPLIAAFIQTSDGKQRSIANFARNIANTIQITSDQISDLIRETRMDDGHVTANSCYEQVAENFDVIINHMQLDWNEGVKLRNGKMYYADES